MPRISFIVPVYQKPLKTLERCLRSLFSQSIKDIEVITVFDGADEELEKLVQKKFKRAQIVVQAHAGAPAARNTGAQLATGEFISFWDADCYIEPGAAAVWLQAFEKYPEVDFVYSGYKFVPEGSGAIDSEPFDPWLLKVNNYISGVFPIRRDKAPKWDESLKSLQDWDFWLQAVENGSKGFYLKGYGFWTELPDPKSISGQGCNNENWLPRIEAVKAKHNIPLRSLCVSAIAAREEGIRLAKMLDADYRDLPTDRPNKYTTVIQLGFDPTRADIHASNFNNPYGPQPKRILFWRAQDVWTLKNKAAFGAVSVLAMVVNKSVNYQFCEDKVTKESLREMGFAVVALPMPLDMNGVKSKMPEKFRLLVDADDKYKELAESVRNSMPDVETVKFEGAVNPDNISALLSLHGERSIDLTARKMLLFGKPVISNIQAPFCGYVDELDDLEVFRNNLIRQVRIVSERNKANDDAAKYYAEACSPEKFKATLKNVGVLEAV